jgi:hypothetical protein
VERVAKNVLIVIPVFEGVAKPEEKTKSVMPAKAGIHRSLPHVCGTGMTNILSK